MKIFIPNPESGFSPLQLKVLQWLEKHTQDEKAATELLIIVGIIPQ